MAQVMCELDGTAGAKAAARQAIADVKTTSVALVGVARAPRFDVPAPAVGDRIRRFQRIEGQLVRLAREAREAGLGVAIALPGHALEPLRAPAPERLAA